MGGRSRKQPFVGRWDWLKELSDKRLDNYGKMSAAKYRQNYSDRSKSALHDEAAAEFQRRHGHMPTWYFNPYLSSSNMYTSKGNLRPSKLHSGAVVEFHDPDIGRVVRGVVVKRPTSKTLGRATYIQIDGFEDIGPSLIDDHVLTKGKCISLYKDKSSK